ncbi:MAG: sensor domain-containing diguanylate cyclase [Pseudomonadota bacterium]
MIDRKKRYLFILSLLLVTGFFLTSFASYFVSLASLRTQIETSQLPLTSDTVYSEIQRDLLKPVFISSIMASDTFLRDWVINGEADTDKITRYLNEIKTRYDTVTSFFVSDATHKYYFHEGILKTVSETSDRDVWYFRVRDMKPDYEINIDPDMANRDAMTIFVNHKVFDYGGRYIGATGVGLTILSVKDLIENYQKKYNRDIFFTDRQGLITLHGTSFTEPATHITDIPGIAALSQTILSSPMEALRYKAHGTTIHLNTRFIPEIGWYLLVQQTEDKAVKGIVNALVMNLVVCSIITAVILTLSHITLSAYQERIETMATTDKLTGCFNRNAFDIITDQSIRETRRNNQSLSLIMFDLDDFKKVNDRLGHQAGDVVLRTTAGTVRSLIRKSDTLCRWGGEEFLILLKECSLEDAAAMAEKIRSVVIETPAIHDQRKVPITLSLGVSQMGPDETLDSFLSRADQALYMAKQKGKNRTEKAAETTL